MIALSTIQILQNGQRLLLKARAAGDDSNLSMMFVHNVMLEAFRGNAPSATELDACLDQEIRRHTTSTLSRGQFE